MNHESVPSLPGSKRESSSNTSETDRLLGEVASDFFERVARGEQPCINDYCERYPQIADLIRETFAAVSFI